LKKFDEILFLKRTPRWDERTKTFIPMLNELSIAKMMALTDSDLTDDEVLPMIVNQATMEMSYHTKQKFLTFVSEFNPDFGLSYEHAQDLALQLQWWNDEIEPPFEERVFQRYCLAQCSGASAYDKIWRFEE